MHGFNREILQSLIEMLAVLYFTLDFIFLGLDFIDFILDFQQAACRSAGIASDETLFKFLLFLIQICILFLESFEMRIAFIKETVFTEIPLITL